MILHPFFGILNKNIFTNEQVCCMDRLQMRDNLKAKLPNKRFEHSLGVEYTAGTMAFFYGVDLEKALVAGLLHDCAKYVANDKKISKLEKRNIPITKCEYKNPDLLHAKLSAVYAKEKYDVDDKEILTAIAWHTTGHPGMSTLEKIIYIADYIEPGRKTAPNLDEVRHLAFENLDEALYKILSDTLDYLQDGEQKVDPMTAKTYEYYKEKREEN